MFRQRTIPEIVLELVSIKAEQLRKTRYAEVMPYIAQELLEFTLQAIKNWIEAPTSVAQACAKAIADVQKFYKELNENFQLPRNYQQILEEVVAMVAFLCCPASRFVREEDRQDISKLIAALEQKV